MEVHAQLQSPAAFPRANVEASEGLKRYEEKSKRNEDIRGEWKKNRR